MAAIYRELEEELGLTKAMLNRGGVVLRSYCKHQDDWDGSKLVFQRFLAELDHYVPVQLSAGQKAFCWTSVPPVGGLISPLTEALMITLRLGGYLY